MKKVLYLSLFLTTVAHAGTIYAVGPQSYVHYTGIGQYHAPFSHVKPHLISQTYHNPFSKQ